MHSIRWPTIAFIALTSAILWNCWSEEIETKAGRGEDRSESGVRTVDSVDEAGALHLAIPRGTVLRAFPSREAPALDVARSERLVPVLEEHPEWARVEWTATDCEEDEAAESADGWVESATLVRTVVRDSDAGPRPAREIELGVAEAARVALGPDSRRSSCGGYALWTDASDPELEVICTALASSLEARVAAVTGLKPVGEPRETLVVFREASGFREFAGRITGVKGGTAAFAVPSRGFLAAARGREPLPDFAKTLGHEMAHLVLARSLGAALPPWLAEGLADALGDAVRPDGGLARELLVQGRDELGDRFDTYLASGGEWDLAGLLSTTSEGFDQEPLRMDYERSAVFVRWLLSAEDTRLRSLLASTARGEGVTREEVEVVFGRPLDQVEADALRWWRSRAERR